MHGFSEDYGIVKYYQDQPEHNDRVVGLHFRCNAGVEPLGQ